MSDVRRCEKCHEGVPVHGRDHYTSIVLKKDIVTLCEECHAANINSDKHPVDIRPERQIPHDLHLDNYYSITCVTCHDPHGEAFSDYPFVPYTWLDRAIRTINGEKEHRTYYLRKSNADGELCISCHTRSSLLSGGQTYVLEKEGMYVGSKKCRECHGNIYKEWQKTLHARFVGDPSKQLNVVRANFDGDKPFVPEDILYTLGEHWTQRYVVKGKKEPMVRPEIWSIQSSEWISTGSYNRSWYRYCVGCHSTGFNPFKGTFVESGIGCEACHGPGVDHCETTDQFDIVNPAKLIEERRDMICEACHSNGHDRSGHYRFPVGFYPGDDLMNYFKGLIPRPGQDNDSYTGDGSYEDRHRQYNFWISRYNMVQGVICDVCKNFRPGRGTPEGEMYLSSEELCATCHEWYWTNFNEHSKHDPDLVSCVECHPPALTVDKKSHSIHDHKFVFDEPIYPENLPMEKRCRFCHGEEISLSALYSGKEE